ncbi:TIGR03013 family PEP-CTERM/XrtA system glycosyltransferase [Desulfovibrio sp. OttesenSCG-928-M16]|nr:TIGR03013 family PEP-CTERM/XrtA system glycosyltransferase [Desulfovibrio sp. OttesenSCG-928-M16]
MERIVFRFADLVCILIALAFSSWLMLPPYLEIFADYTGASTFTVIIFLLSFYMMNCYNVGREDFRDTIIRVVVAVVVGIVAAGFVFYTFERWRFPRMMFVLQMAVNLALSLGWRRLYFLFGKRLDKVPSTVLLLGAASAGRARRVLGEYAPESRIIGYVGEEGAAAEEAGPWLGPAEDIFRVIAERGPNKVIVLDRFYLDQDITHALFKAKMEGLNVSDMRGLYEKLAARVPIDLIEDDWFLLEDGFNLNVNNGLRRLKRAFDICFSLSLLVLTSPLLLAAIVAVRLDSPGPALFRQERVGLNGREFTLYKLRSMRLDAEKDGAQWALDKDPRVTRVGRILRKSRIDELPQLFNVLKGEMSLIGPRPERMAFVRELSEKLPYYNVRHSVKPGVTGWAQVRYPYGASLDDARYKLEYDLFYIKHLSALLEIKILLRTVGVILYPKGAR